MFQISTNHRTFSHLLAHIDCLRFAEPLIRLIYVFPTYDYPKTHSILRKFFSIAL